MKSIELCINLLLTLFYFYLLVGPEKKICLGALFGHISPYAAFKKFLIPLSYKDYWNFNTGFYRFLGGKQDKKYFLI